ncbi:MAG: carbon starvation protein A, partial [Verrucomicrobiota bacterium]|nr:carbon starvation protein A [Verrucomicrobiota bacterium]
VILIVVLSLREWILLLAKKKLAQLRETEPIWLPAYALIEEKPLHIFGLLTLLFALAKHLSGETEMERAQKKNICVCENPIEQLNAKNSPQEIYAEVTDKRFTGINRCC